MAFEGVVSVFQGLANAEVLAAVINFGITSIYYLILLVCVGSLSIPRLARWGAYGFFFGCGSIHILMGLEGLGISEPSFPLLALIVNVMQLVGGWVFIVVMVWVGEREIRLRGG